MKCVRIRKKEGKSIIHKNTIFKTLGRESGAYFIIKAESCFKFML